MNVMLLSASAVAHGWLQASLSTLVGNHEINRCDSVELGLRILQVDDNVQLVIVDADLVPCEVAPAIKALWRTCRSAVLVAIASAPTHAEMVLCVNAGALGYVPRWLTPKDLGQVLGHLVEGSLWLPDLRTLAR